MFVISVAAALVAITVVVLAFLAIPTLVEAKKTAIAAREFISRTDSELQPALQELRVVIGDLKALTSEAAEHSDDVKTCMEAIGNTGRNLNTINSMVGTVAGAVSTSSLWWTGAKVAGKYLMERARKRRE